MDFNIRRYIKSRSISLNEQAWKGSACRPGGGMWTPAALWLRRRPHNSPRVSYTYGSRWRREELGIVDFTGVKLSTRSATSLVVRTSLLSCRGSLNGRRDRAQTAREVVFALTVWVEATERGDVGISGTQGAMIKISPEARGQVVNRLCSAVAKHCASRLLSKPEIKFSRCCHGVRWTITLSVAAASRVSIDALFTRLVSMYYFSMAHDIGWTSAVGNVAKYRSLFFTCNVHSAARQLKHDAVLHRLWKACRLPEVMRVNQRVEGVSSDATFWSRDQARALQELWYTTSWCHLKTVGRLSRTPGRGKSLNTLAKELQRQGYHEIVTALGLWNSRNEAVLRLLRVGFQQWWLIISDTIHWSQNIYWNTCPASVST